MSELHHISMCHITHVNESCHTCQCAMSHISMCHVTHVNVSCHTCQCVMSHISMCHVTHINVSCHTYQRVMSHISMCHVTHVNVSCHSYCLYIRVGDTCGVGTHMLCTHTCTCICIYRYMYMCPACIYGRGTHVVYMYGVATISRLLKIIGLFCKRAL